MTKQTNEDQDCFIPGTSYDFLPALTTYCIPVSGGEWSQKSFSHGWCLKHEGGRRYAFQGKPRDEQIEHYFHVEWGKGSVAKDAPPKHLRVVK